MAFYNRRLSIIARKRWAAGCYGRRNTGHRFLIWQGASPDFRLWRLLRNGLWSWFKAELGALRQIAQVHGHLDGIAIDTALAQLDCEALVALDDGANPRTQGCEPRRTRTLLGLGVGSAPRARSCRGAIRPTPATSRSRG